MVEDDESVKEQIAEYLVRYSKEKNLEYSLTWFESAEAFLASAELDSYKMLFLDILLPNMNGMDCAKEIREVNDEIIIIFVTVLSNYAIKGYEVDASDYIIKPFNYGEFISRFEHVLIRKRKKSGVTIQVKSDQGDTVINVKDIYYVDVVDHDITYHTTHGHYRVHGSLSANQDILLENDFFKCIRYCLINLQYVVLLNEDEVVISIGQKGETKKIPLRRGAKKELVLALDRYYKKRI